LYVEVVSSASSEAEGQCWGTQLAVAPALVRTKKPAAEPFFIGLLRASLQSAKFLLKETIHVSYDLVNSFVRFFSDEPHIFGSFVQLQIVYQQNMPFWRWDAAYR
jgi:hypothetical protein